MSQIWVPGLPLTYRPMTTREAPASL